MENIGTHFDSDSPFLDDPEGRPRRSVADWWRLTVLAMGVLAVGFLVGALGPLFAVACDACQDGVRNPHSIDVLIAIAWYGVPLTTLETVVGVFLPRGGGRAGPIGLGMLVALLLLMVFLGQLVTHQIAEKRPGDEAVGRRAWCSLAEGRNTGGRPPARGGPAQQPAVPARNLPFPPRG